jgi:hypothetical protein
MTASLTQPRHMLLPPNQVQFIVAPAERIGLRIPLCFNPRNRGQHALFSLMFSAP